jgi:hypothetical protein
VFIDWLVVIYRLWMDVYFPSIKRLDMEIVSPETKKIIQWKDFGLPFKAWTLLFVPGHSITCFSHRYTV